MKASALDYETQAGHEITIKAQSSDGTSNSKDFYIKVGNVVEEAFPTGYASYSLSSKILDLDLGGDYINPLSNDGWRINLH